MPVRPTYRAVWLRQVGDALRSYRDTLEDLLDAREHYYTRPFLVPGDRDGGGRDWRVEVPLLWGLF